MNVDRERERWGVVSKPDLHLLGIEPTAEKHGRAGVPERVKANPGNARRPRRALQGSSRTFEASRCLPLPAVNAGVSSERALASAIWSPKLLPPGS